MLNVFISHNFKDKPLARKIALILNSYGVKTWIDESEIKLGDSLIEKIRSGIDEGDYLIALISKNSIDSEWVKRELDIAMNQEIEGKKVKVVPILVGNCELPGFLKGKLYADMSTKRKFSDSIPVLLSRFNIEFNKDIKQSNFTSLKLTVTEIINKLDSDNEIIRTDIVDRFSYGDKEIFKISSFVEYLNSKLTDSNTDEELLLNIMHICRFCPENEILKIKFSTLLECSNENILIKVIDLFADKKGNKTIDKRILNLFKGEISDELREICIKYFSSRVIDNDFEDDLIYYCEMELEKAKEFKTINNLIKILVNQFNGSNDDIIKVLIRIWENGNEKIKNTVIKSFCSHSEWDGIYIRSPRMRDKLKSIMLESLGDDDILNSEIITMLLVNDSSIFSNKEEVWEKIYSIDKYSLIALVENIRDTYNISYIFNNNEDVQNFRRLLDNENKEVKELALDIIAEIKLESSLKILEEQKYVPKFYNATDIVMTLIKETSIKEFEELYKRAKDIILSGYIQDIDIVLTSLCDYIIDNKFEDKLIKDLGFKIDDITLGIRQNDSKLTVICDKLESIKSTCKEENQKVINGFLAKCKKYIED